ncbi:DUF305 domain-containing protein [Amycolatopsis sp. cg5]|uniref:DUF305 domain-containing protein n=1 Tax=Amycolatopsis sp. cg5 TaxID=3238802 RepID=UPI003523A8F1
MKFRIALAAGLLTLTGCGAGGPAAPATEFNPTDVMFLQMMIPHHQQGIDIARLAKEHHLRPEIQVLANAIDVTQVNEVADMKAWLEGWAQPPTADAAPDAHAHHGGNRLTPPDEVAELKAAKPEEFEKLFVNILTAHQHNAVELAQTEAAGGAAFKTKDLANRIIQSRTGEIKQLLGFLG